MLNPSFRNPALLAKMLATLDQITHGRVICAIGAGWFEDEYTAYDVPFIADHDERIAHEREVVLLLRELCTSAAPVTFEGRYATVRNLAFSPRPFQQPHPPIWIGGNSPTTQALVAELADGWVLLSRGDIAPVLAEARARADWPRRELAIVGAAQYQPEETLRARLAELESLGVNYVRMTFGDSQEQARFADEELRQVLGAASRSAP
jgi:alkanesulfonate monooxygenase SsuD/methylene tetrahydromethanopterin reductase-like flavin-dependent oxidoreductase (luciferase family)